MAFTDLGTLGATGSTAGNQASLVLTTSAGAAVGELVVVVIADDNRLATADADGSEVSGVSDNSSGGPNTWLKGKGWANNNAATQGGAAVQIWYTVVSKAIASGGTITATFTSASLSDATAITARHFSFSGSDGVYVSVAATNTLSNDAADPGALDATTANVPCLRIRGIAGEVGTATSLTPTATWTAWDNGNSATSGTIAEMCARAEHLISTGTSASSDPTWVASDCASAYIAFQLLLPSWDITAGDDYNITNLRRRRPSHELTSIPVFPVQPDDTAFLKQITNYGSPRHLVDAKVGFKFTVGAAGMRVNSLARWIIAGNAESHTLSIARVSDNVDIASVACTTAGANPGEWKFVKLATPLYLSPGVSYYCYSQEGTGTQTDYWWDADNTQVSWTSDATFNNGDQLWGTTHFTSGAPWVSGPTNFRYTLLSPNATPSALLVDTYVKKNPKNFLGEITGPPRTPPPIVAVPSFDLVVGDDYVNPRRKTPVKFLGETSFSVPLPVISSSFDLVVGDDFINYKRRRPTRFLGSIELPSQPDDIAYITEVTSFGTLRSDFGCSSGIKFTVGPRNIVVNSLARWIIAGNSASHTLRLTQVSDDVDIATAECDTSGATTDQFKFVSLASPVTIYAGQSYYVYSDELDGGDQWYNDDTTFVTTTSDATHLGGAQIDDAHLDHFSSPPPHANVPVNFRYTLEPLADTPSAANSLFVESYANRVERSLQGDIFAPPTPPAAPIIITFDLFVGDDYLPRGSVKVILGDISYTHQAIWTARTPSTQADLLCVDTFVKKNPKLRLGSIEFPTLAWTAKTPSTHWDMVVDDVHKRRRLQSNAETIWRVGPTAVTTTWGLTLDEALKWRRAVQIGEISFYGEFRTPTPFVQSNLLVDTFVKKNPKIVLGEVSFYGEFRTPTPFTQFDLVVDDHAKRDAKRQLGDISWRTGPAAATTTWDLTLDEAPRAPSWKRAVQSGEISFAPQFVTPAVSATVQPDLFVDTFVKNNPKLLLGELAFPALAWTAKTPSIQLDMVVGGVQRAQRRPQSGADTAWNIGPTVATTMWDLTLDEALKWRRAVQLGEITFIPPVVAEVVTATVQPDLLVETFVKKNPKLLLGDVAFPALAWTAKTPITQVDFVEAPRKPAQRLQAHAELPWRIGPIPVSICWDFVLDDALKGRRSAQFGEIILGFAPQAALTPSAKPEFLVETFVKKNPKIVLGDAILPYLAWTAKTPSTQTDLLVDTFVKKNPKVLLGEVAFPALAWTAKTPATQTDLLVETFVKKNPAKLLGEVSQVVRSFFALTPSTSANLFVEAQKLKPSKQPAGAIGQSFVLSVNITGWGFVESPAGRSAVGATGGEIALPYLAWTAKTPSVQTDLFVDTFVKKNQGKQLGSAVLERFPVADPANVPSAIWTFVEAAPARPLRQRKGEIAFPPLAWTAKTPATQTGLFVDTFVKKNPGKQQGDAVLSRFPVADPATTPTSAAYLVVDAPRAAVRARQQAEAAFTLTVVTAPSAFGFVVDAPRRARLARSYSADVTPSVTVPAAQASTSFNFVVDAVIPRVRRGAAVDSILSPSRLGLLAETPTTWFGLVVDAVQPIRRHVAHDGAVNVQSQVSAAAGSDFGLVVDAIRPAARRRNFGDENIWVSAFPTAKTPSEWFNQIIVEAPPAPKLLRQPNGNIAYPYLRRLVIPLVASADMTVHYPPGDTVVYYPPSSAAGVEYPPSETVVEFPPEETIVEFPPGETIVHYPQS